MKTDPIGIVLLSAALIVTLSNSQSVLAQKLGIGGGANQIDKDNKDKENKEKEKENDKDENQSSQNNSNDNPSNSGKKKSGNSNLPTNIQQLLQGKQGKNVPRQGGNKGEDNQDQDGSNKSKSSNRPGFPNQQFQDQQQGRKFQEEDGDNRNRIRFGTWNGDRWQGSHKIDNWSKVFGHNQQPFSSQWYKEHPQAWKYDNKKSNKSTVWVVATVPGVYSWLGWGNVPPQYQVNYNNGPQFDPSQYGDWYPLGVYSLMTGPDDMGSRVVQLAVDRRGRINGNYYDMITNSDHGVSGEIDRQSQRAVWSLNNNRNVRFRASIMRLLQPYGSVTVELPGGEQRWQFVRLEN